MMTKPLKTKTTKSKIKVLKDLPISPEKKDQAKSKRLWDTYGITIKEWDLLLKQQNGVCAVCKALPGKGILCVDHIHVKGFKAMPPIEKVKYVRGLVCFMCNTGFKSFEKTVSGTRNRQALHGTFEYFQKYRLKGEL